MNLSAGEDTLTAEPRWLSSNEQWAWRAYLRGSRALEVAMDRDLQPHGIGLSEYELLSMLSEAPGGRMRMSALADMIIQSRSRVTHTASRLEARGWVTREPCEDDRRGVQLVLTDSGRHEIEQMARLHVNSVREHFLDHLTEDEIDTMGHIMAEVLRTIEPDAVLPTQGLQ